MKVDRRSFLSFVIGGAAGTVLSPLPWKLADDASIWSQQWPWTPVPQDGAYTYEDSTCSLCPGGCGISVRKVDNRAVKIEGKKGHPINDGGICIKGLSGLQLLYGPTRVKSPMKRVGERGEGKWKRISWNEATALLAEKLTELRDGGQSHTVGAIAGPGGGTVPALLERFMTAYGSPNFIRMPSPQDAEVLAVKMLFEDEGRIGYDLENADYVLSFGSGLLDGWGSPVRTFRANSKWKKNRATVVQVEPRLSNTAAKANRWVPINPGTEADLALGLAAAMVKNNMVGSCAVSELSSVEKDLLDNYPAKKVAQITGVPADVINNLATAFATANRPLALCGRGKGEAGTSLREAAAIHLLNALVDNINQKGGIYILPYADYIQWPREELDLPAATGLAKPRLDGAGSKNYINTESLADRLIPAINGEKPYSLGLLMVAGSNPCHDLADATKVKEALAKIPFIVSFSSFNDDTAQMADLLMPDHVYLERYEDVPVEAGILQQVIGLSKPVVSPQFNTRHLGETVITVAKAVGGTVAGAFAWEDYETCLQETMGDKWYALIKDGVWVEKNIDPVASQFRMDGMNTPALQAEGDVEGFPLLLIPFDSIRISTGYIGAPPFMIKTVADTVIKGKDGFVEINPQTATEIGLVEGAPATLTTTRGQARVRVHLSEGIMPGVIAMVRGLGHTAYDGFLADKGVNINALIGPVEDPSSGLNAAWGIRAVLAKA